MNVIRCKNGHFFDGDSYSACPHCGESAAAGGNAAPVKEEKKGFWGKGRKDKSVDGQPLSYTPPAMPRSDIGNTPTDVMERVQAPIAQSPASNKEHTLDFWQMSPRSESQPVAADAANESHNALSDNCEEPRPVGAAPVIQTEPIKEAPREEPKHAPEQPSLRDAVKSASASNEGKTMSYFSSATAPSGEQARPAQPSEPVVGWLVCVGGVNFGNCFNIYAGKNSIGRSDENRIVIPDDNSISRSKHALIVYEPKKRNFYLQPGDSSGLTYLNDEYITDSHKLAANDIIELGESKFMFVPLCGDAFSWEEYMPKGD